MGGGIWTGFFDSDKDLEYEIFENIRKKQLTFLGISNIKKLKKTMIILHII
ncbi:hypothetical protein YN1_5280 [Nanoarchaeota archaeon]